MEPERPESSAPDSQLSGGPLLSAISTRIVSILREHYGRGPMRAKTYVLDDLVVCVLNRFTAIEQTMVTSGEPERVVEMRRDFQNDGRQVPGHDRGAHRPSCHRLSEPSTYRTGHHPRVFLLDEPLDGFGAAELIEAKRLDLGPPQTNAFRRDAANCGFAN